MQQELIDIEGAGTTYAVPLDDESAPNVYLTVTLLGEDEEGDLGFRYGLVNLPVEPNSAATERRSGWRCGAHRAGQAG